LLFFFVLVSVLMCLVVLMQKSKQEGLGAAFGQGAIGDILGTGVSSFLVKTTVILAALFFILSISLARLYSHRASLMEKGSPLQQELMKPAATTTAPASSSASPAPTTVTPATTTTTSTSTLTVPASAAPTTQPTKPAK